MNNKHASIFHTASRRGFTLVELLTVIAVIAILAAMILGVSSYVQNKAATSRAQGEIGAMSAACEAYKADNAVYPRDTNTDKLDAKTAYDPAKYTTASLALYKALSGDANLNTNRTVASGQKSYFTFKSNMLLPSGGTSAVTSLVDPFGSSYGYSTAYDADLQATPPINPPTHGYNPTFDLWSTAGTTSATTSANHAKWVKNW